MPVLVLDGHSRAALETLQSLGRAGIEVDIAAESLNCLAMHSRYASRKVLQPSQSSGTFQNWLQDRDRNRNYELIVPATEASLRCLRLLDEDDPVRCKAVLPSNYALDIGIDKEKTCALAVQLGVPVPRSRLISSLNEIKGNVTLPVVLKPVRSKVMVGAQLRTLAVAVVTTAEQRHRQLQEWLPMTAVLEQEYVAGKGVGAEFLFDRGRKVWHFVHERVHEYPLSGGASSYRKSIAAPARLLADAEKLLVALNWHGVAMVEFKVNSDGQHWLMEINPRFWGSLALCIDAGVDFPIGLLKVARGESPPPQPNYRTHFYSRDLRTDVEWFKANLKADPRNRLLHTRPHLRSFAELLRPMLGRESWDHFDWRDLALTFRMIAQIASAQFNPVLQRLRRSGRDRDLRHHHQFVLNHISRVPVREIAFICLGNICRSPLAAKLAEQQISATEIISAGFHHKTGRSSPEKIIQIGAGLGVDLSDHRSRLADSQLLREADLILVMDSANMQQMEQTFPELFQRTTLLGLFANTPLLNIADPYSATPGESFKICLQIRDAINGLAASLNHLPARCTDQAAEPNPATTMSS